MCLATWFARRAPRLLEPVGVFPKATHGRAVAPATHATETIAAVGRLTSENTQPTCVRVRLSGPTTGGRPRENDELIFFDIVKISSDKGRRVT